MTARHERGSKRDTLLRDTEDFKQINTLRTKYFGTDKWLKAPNGKNTNLSELQWLLVRTDNFKNWFGDWINHHESASKILDSNGEPLIVFHGTPDGGFSFFDTRG